MYRSTDNLDLINLHEYNEYYLAAWGKRIIKESG